MRKILLLGASGYMGGAFKAALAKRNFQVLAPSRAEMNYSNFEVLHRYIRELGGIDFLINAAGFTGKPNVEQCEVRREETLQGNLLLPQMLSHLAAVENFRWLQISSGCIYEGNNGGNGFTEEDEPNFSFKYNNCSFYSGVKAVAENYLREDSRCYVARLRIPFDENDGPRNYITKLLTYPKIYDNINSISHIGDFVRTCIDLYENNCPTGIYNITNEGGISTREVVAMIQELLDPTREFDYFVNDEEFYRVAKTPRSNCILNVNKLAALGLRMRPVREALKEAIENWVPARL
ncbi:sugar nucleotide-binding protein [bacterium]|nr:sugar nucleotide-binding protein [bacterium]